MARPVDPSVPQFALNSTIVPTKVLTDPQGLDQALQSGLQAVGNGGYNLEAAQAAAAAGNEPSYPEAYQVNILGYFSINLFCQNCFCAASQVSMLHF